MVYNPQFTIRNPQLNRVPLDRYVFLFTMAVLAAAVAYPSFRLVVDAFRLWRWDALVSGPGYEAVRNTVLIGIGSVLTSGVFGTALAFLVARCDVPGRRLLSTLAYLPFALPPLVGVLSFYYLIGRDGILPRTLEHAFGWHGVTLQGPAAILLIHTHAFYVFFYAMVSAALANLDPSLAEAARTLGAKPRRVAAYVTLPLLRPALAGAALLTFMASAASFSAPYFFGQDFAMLSTRVYSERMQFHQDTALTLTMALAAISLAGLVVFRAKRYPTRGASKGAPRFDERRPARRWGVGIALWAVMALLLVPHATILWLAFIDHRAWQAELFPTHLTLANFTALIHDPRALVPIRNSLWMSALAAAVTLAVALPAGYLIGRRRPGARFVGLLSMLPWALPGTVVAMSLITAFNDPWLPLYNTIWMLPLAYIVRGLPMLTRMAAASIEPFDASLWEAGRTLGASPAYCLRRIVLPQIAPALAAATALVFVTSLGEFVASILLYLPANIPIAVQINMEWRGNVGIAFAYAVLLMTLVCAAFIASRRIAAHGGIFGRG